MEESLQEPKLGILDFLGHQEYSLLAVKAPIEATIEAFIEFRKQQKTRRNDYNTCRNREVKIIDRNIRLEKNIPIRSSEQGAEIQIDVIVFLQIKNNEWTIIIRSLGFIHLEEIYEVPEAAKELSTKFQTKAITLMEEDTSSAFGYELFENGELVEHFEAADWIQFNSKLRSTPECFVELDEEEKEDCYYITENNKNIIVYNATYGFDRIKFVDKVYRGLGIYLPDCYPVENGGKPGLALGKASENMIERADLLFIEEILES